MISRIAATTALLLVAATACSRTASPPAAALETVAEQSQFARTGRYDEVERLCAAYAQTWPDAVRCTEFGRTPEGRPMLALVASRAGALTADEARTRNLPVLLVQGGIHAGEIDGKDAGFLALRQLLRDEAAPGALSSFVLVFVPVFNADGHERFGRWNRPNQTGPEEIGWRTTAQNLNLNRDYTKADAPEMQAMLRLLNSWNPVLYVDLHVTDGAQFQHDVSNTLEPRYAGGIRLEHRHQLRTGLKRSDAAQSKRCADCIRHDRVDVSASRRAARVLAQEAAEATSFDVQGHPAAVLPPSIEDFCCNV